MIGRMKKATQALVRWYDENKRDLPWRGEDAYRVWLSEMLLQQTRVDTGTAYYHRFCRAYPSIGELAAAPQEEVLKLWEGLGYYNRARNMHKAARMVVENYGGVMPDTYEKIIKLPGVGDYTAAAVLSMAYGVPIPAVDGNALRVAARICAIGQCVDEPKTRKAIRDILDEAMDRRRPGIYNQAVMELGALICLPRQMRCGQCPVRDFCAAYEKGLTDKLPVKKKKAPQKLERYAVIVLERSDGKVLVRKRKSRGLLADMWEFILLPVDEHEKARQAALKWLEISGIQADQIKKIGRMKHVFTHRIWMLEGFHVLVRGEPEIEGRWVDGSGFSTLPFGTAISRYTAYARKELFALP